ncbi:MAG: Gfo/Idh/MocA family oxidoreductase [Bacteroidales bacterium]|nr:Gfo/Idh/MocA family oxidoreductase [Bacteroidales bacterium]
MDKEKAIVGFIGAGGIARSHAYSLNSLKYYYNDAPEIESAAVCTTKQDSREPFAKRFGFLKSCDLKKFLADKRINTVFILGPNKVHFEHIKAVLEMSSIKRIYIEKPVCSNLDEENAIRKLAETHPGIKIQVGFQYLFTAAIREALIFWKSGKLGMPLHFDIKYYHSDYLKKEYRDKRASRLTPAPDGGAMADLGSHAVSLLIAFLGNRLHITGALQSGHFDDVTDKSDLFSQISLYDEITNAVGTLSASRISSGSGDNLSLEFYAEKGSLRYSSCSSDYFEYYNEETDLWVKKMVGSNYKPVTSFPSGHVPPGWLRPMVHAHYVFFTGHSDEVVIPDIEHGLQVQRLVRETAERLRGFRENKCNY